MRTFVLAVAVGLLGVALSFVSAVPPTVVPEIVAVTEPPRNEERVDPTPSPTRAPKPPVKESVDRFDAAGTVPWAKVTDAIFGAFGRGTASRMVAVADCETGGDGYQPLTDVGAAGELGPLQIHPGWWTKWPSVRSPLVQSMGYKKRDLLDPYVSAKVGAKILDLQGIDAWTCS